MCGNRVRGTLLELPSSRGTLVLSGPGPCAPGPMWVWAYVGLGPCGPRPRWTSLTSCTSLICLASSKSKKTYKKS